MGEDEVEGLTLSIDVTRHLLQMRRQQGEESLVAQMFVQFGRIGEEMGKYGLWIFHGVIIAALFAGCGYKDDPYYIDDTNATKKETQR